MNTDEDRGKKVESIMAAMARLLGALEGETPAQEQLLRPRVDPAPDRGRRLLYGVLIDRFGKPASWRMRAAGGAQAWTAGVMEAARAEGLLAGYPLAEIYCAWGMLADEASRRMAAVERGNAARKATMQARKEGAR